MNHPAPNNGSDSEASAFDASAIDASAFDALTFDVYGTLIDWEAGILTALQPWRTRTQLQLTDSEVHAAFANQETAVQIEDPALPYPQVLQRVLHRMSTTLCSDAIDAIATSGEMQLFGESVGAWPPFADSSAALNRLSTRFKLGILSNVDRASLDLSMNALAAPFDVVVTAQDVGAYKPDPRGFLHLQAKLRQQGVSTDRILHVAQSLYHDHVPAREVGMPAVWIDRRDGKPGAGATPAEPDCQPRWRYTNLGSFADALDV